MGALSSNEEVKELENVVKIFFIEEKVIDLTSNFETKKVIEKILPDSLKYNNHNNKVTQFLTVRGLN